MNKIEFRKDGSVFGALKLIEQLYLDDKIPGYIFRNIIKEYGDVISVSNFRCYKDKSPPENEGEE